MKERLKRLPVVGFLLRWIYNIIRINNIKYLTYQLLEENEKLKEQLSRQKEEILKQQEERCNDILFKFQDQLLKIEEELENKSDKRDTTQLYLKLVDEKIVIEKYIKALQKSLDKESNKNITTQTLNKSLLDIYYKSFEDRFRGDKEEIKKTLLVYLPIIKSLTHMRDEIFVVDLGCGRGEWLEILEENNINYLGIDSNEVMVRECSSRNLKVKHTDALGYLKKLNDNSVDCITGFHIIEHFNSFDEVLELLQESLRVLKNGGKVIFETPNPRNILVGSNDFYIDPTHNKPLHPLTMKFFLKEIGFYKSYAYIVNNDTLKEIDEIEFNSIEDYVNIGRNYALIGEKL